MYSEIIRRFLVENMDLWVFCSPAFSFIDFLEIPVLEASLSLPTSSGTECLLSSLSSITVASCRPQFVDATSKFEFSNHNSIRTTAPETNSSLNRSICNNKNNNQIKAAVNISLSFFILSFLKFFFTAFSPLRYNTYFFSLVHDS